MFLYDTQNITKYTHSILSKANSKIKDKFKILHKDKYFYVTLVNIYKNNNIQRIFYC